MPTPFHQQQTDAIRAAYARTHEVDPSAFDRDELTVVTRPPAPWPQLAFVITFGRGTVVSVEPEYRDFVDQLTTPTHPDQAAWPAYLGSIVAEANRRGATAVAGPTAILFALTAPPDQQTIPDGLQLRRLDRDWMAAEQPGGRFPNGIGKPEETHRTARNHYAYALIDATDEPIAIAGAFDTIGLHEIGVDVAPAAQGRNLAPIVVTAATRAALDAGATPMYACTATNTRSQRTALASGYLPVGADATVN